MSRRLCQQPSIMFRYTIVRIFFYNMTWICLSSVFTHFCFVCHLSLVIGHSSFVFVHPDNRKPNATLSLLPHASLADLRLPSSGLFPFRPSTPTFKYPSFVGWVERLFVRWVSLAFWALNCPGGMKKHRGRAKPITRAPLYPSYNERMLWMERNLL